MMWRDDIREWWLTSGRIACRMADGKFAMLIRGPSNDAVARGDWKFGFQVYGEQDIRWVQPEQLERVGNALIEKGK